MPFDPQTHHRRSIRRPGYDYSAAGAYFVTICANNRSCLFGTITNGQLIPNDAGRMVRAAWNALADGREGVELDEVVVMPNHVHGIIVFRSTGRPDEGAPPLVDGRGPRGTLPGTLGRAVQAFKSTTTHDYIQGVHERGWPRFSGHLWQRDYFDHVIRTDDSLARIRDYIRTNPQRWGEDAENPAGTGVDDVRIWVHTLPSGRTDSGTPGEGEHEVRPYGGSAPSQFKEGPTQGSPRPAEGGSAGRTILGMPRQGEHKVRPYGDAGDATRAGTAGGAGRTQGSPLQDSNPHPEPGANTRFAPTAGTPVRIGHGYDLHRLQGGGRLILGGIEVANDLSPVAHSDGDVVLHALVDALLGAMAWGDIGEHFPNTDPRWKDAPSRVFVEEVYAKVRAAGYRVGNTDVTILAERPRLKPFKAAMVEQLAQLLHITPSQVNVKAGTNEGCDAIGRGEAVAAHAVVLLVTGD